MFIEVGCNLNSRKFVSRRPRPRFLCRRPQPRLFLLSRVFERVTSAAIRSANSARSYLFIACERPTPFLFSAARDHTAPNSHPASIRAPLKDKTNYSKTVFVLLKF